ncbi:Lipoprotein [Vibrio crassostreae]|nr:Lipoprotein [Vibrio crassostreae]CAK2290976.1 Lipoprotein [Vibrio crassostreae]CAK2470318.1 Lipoprotein [Vibrio crassostreae]CAK2729637.1 Lipoprotein [Vibrio crassostreae]
MNRLPLLISGCSSALLLTGCLTDTSRPFEVPQLALFKGMYENADNDSYLLFESGQVTYQTTDNSVTRTYRVDDDLITIEFNSGSSRTDSRLVMRIQHQGEMLTCNQCPAIQLSNVWTLVDRPLKDSSN